MNKEDMLKAILEEMKKGADVEVGQSLSEELRSIFEEMREEHKPTPSSQGLGLTTSEKEKFSLARAIRGIYRGFDSESKFEGEVIKEATQKALSEGSLQSGGLAA